MLLEAAPLWPGPPRACYWVLPGACPRLEKHRPGGWLAHPGPALGRLLGRCRVPSGCSASGHSASGGPTPHHGSLRPFGWWSPAGFPAPCPAARQDPSLIYRHLPAVSPRRLPPPVIQNPDPSPLAAPASGPTRWGGGGGCFPHALPLELQTQVGILSRCLMPGRLPHGLRVHS